MFDVIIYITVLEAAIRAREVYAINRNGKNKKKK